MKVSPSRWPLPLSPSIPAVLSGVLLAFAFPPVSAGPLVFVSLVPLMVALQKPLRTPRRFFGTGYLFGVTFFLSHLWWVVRLSPDASITMPWLMIPATAALVAYLAVYPALFCLLLRVIGRGRVFVMILLGPALWMVLEWIRSNGELGFPWGAIGYALARYPQWIQEAAYVGVAGVGAFVVLVNMVLSAAAVARGAVVKGALLGAGIVLLVSCGVGGRWSIGRYDGPPRDKEFRVALVQPNVDLALKWQPEFTDSTFRLIERLTAQAALLEPKLVVFPETSAPVYMRYELKYRSRLEKLARRSEVAIFIGFLDGRRDGPMGALNVYNSSGLFSPDGGLTQYDKMHLLPFGEAIPFAWKFRGLRSIDFGQANFQPGPDADPIPSPIGDLGPLICFESIFSDLSRRFAARGADVFVNITNDGWFGDTPGPYQHNDMAILRTVENRRFLVRSANTGITMVVDPVGRVTRTLGLEREGILIETIHAVDESTVYTRHGDAPLMAASLLFILLGVLIAWRDRRRRPRREV